MWFRGQNKLQPPMWFKGTNKLRPMWSGEMNNLQLMLRGEREYRNLGQGREEWGTRHEEDRLHKLS